MNDVKYLFGALFGFGIAFLAGSAAMLAGFGSRWRWWHFRTGFNILRWAAYGGLLAVIVCGLALGVSFRHGRYVSLALSGAGLIIGLAIAGIPWTWTQTAKRVPPIHDITTDTVNPPEFVAVLPFRKNATNPAAYGGPDIAAQQVKAYPDISPLLMDIPAAAAFEKALDIAHRMGWKIVDSNTNEGRIEATDRTFWFGFQDDIIVRITQNDATGSRIDVRSVSRVGKSDVGTNAKRIRAFLTLMQR
jgi:uncharacterized protein (DUF1499 family)